METHEIPSLTRIINETCHDQCVPKIKVLGPKKDQYLIWTRALIAVRARQFKKADGTHVYSFPDIGKAMNRHHTSVMNLCGYMEESYKK